jgi:hypothetical protein
VKLSEICQDPQKYGCLVILPEPQPTAPWGPFKVTRAQMDPTNRFGTITYSRKKEDDWNYRGASLHRGDCLLHVPTGAIASVVSRESRTRVVVEGWAEPGTDEEKAKWANKPGMGQWVVWGVGYRRLEEIPKHARPPEQIAPEDFKAARADLFRHPERLPWAEMGFNVGTHPSKLKGKAKKKLRGKLRKLLGTVLSAMDQEDMDAWIEKHTIKRRKAEGGKGEWITWRA